MTIRRVAFNCFFQDAWKVTPHFSLTYGLRYEVNSRVEEGERRTSTFRTVNAEGKSVPPWELGARQIMILNPQPPYGLDLRGWGPRVMAEWQAASHTVLRAGGGITTLLPPLGIENVLTGVFPFIVSPFLSALPGSPVPFANSLTTLQLPAVYSTSGQLAFPSGRTNDVAPNTELDVPRFQKDLVALTPGHRAQPLSVYGMAPVIPNGYIESYTASLEQTIKERHRQRVLRCHGRGEAGEHDQPQ